MFFGWQLDESLPGQKGNATADMSQSDRAKCAGKQHSAIAAQVDRSIP